MHRIWKILWKEGEVSRPLAVGISWLGGEQVSQMWCRFATVGNFCDFEYNDIPGQERQLHAFEVNALNPKMGQEYWKNGVFSGYIRPVDYVLDGGVIEFWVNDIHDTYGIFDKGGPLRN